MTVVECSLPTASRCRRRVDDRAVPMFHQFSVLHAKTVESKHLIKLSWLSCRILAIVFVNCGHDVAFRSNYFEWISLRRLWTGCSAACPCCTTASGSLSEERILELFVVTYFVLLRAFLECWIVLFVTWIGKRNSCRTGGAEKLQSDFLVCFKLGRRCLAARRRVRRYGRRLLRHKRSNTNQQKRTCKKRIFVCHGTSKDRITTFAFTDAWWTSRQCWKTI